ncbi:MAG: hypothetical protein AAF604_11400 [Acidobacteriota bacterium]
MGASLLGSALVAQEVEFSAPPGEPDLVSVTVRGLPAESLETLSAADLERADWSTILSVVALADADAVAGDLPPLLGTWRVTATGLEFRPRFPPAPGMTLWARFDGAAFDRASGATGTASGEARHLLPDLARGASTEVLAVYPSAAALPANLLRFYVHFSAPMSARRVLPHVRLIDVEGGAPIPDAFVFVEGGLWDPQRTRLTLLVHPGRVKRGVGPNVALGPVLEAGRRYRLEIDGEARDAAGLPLRSEWAHEFRAGPPDHQSPDPAAWRLRPPASHASPLTIELAEPADRALLERVLTVVDGQGTALAGNARAAAGERSWSFQPSTPWQPGTYTLVVSAALEDPSGNRVGRRFEEPLEGASREAEIRLVFEVP